MDFDIFTKTTLSQFDGISGIYLLSHKKYKGYVKIGSGPDLKSRLTSYKTYSPVTSDWRIQAIAIKRPNATSLATMKKINYIFNAERNVQNVFKDKKAKTDSGKTEWYKTSIKSVVQAMKDHHFGNK